MSNKRCANATISIRVVDQAISPGDSWLLFAYVARLLARVTSNLRSVDLIALTMALSPAGSTAPLAVRPPLPRPTYSSTAVQRRLPRSPPPAGMSPVAWDFCCGSAPLSPKAFSSACNVLHTRSTGWTLKFPRMSGTRPRLPRLRPAIGRGSQDGSPT